MSLMVSLDPPFRTPRQSEKEGLFSERHRRPAVALLDQPQTQGVTVEVHGALDILNVDRYSDYRHAFPRNFRYDAPDCETHTSPLRCRANRTRSARSLRPRLAVNSRDREVPQIPAVPRTDCGLAFPRRPFSSGRSVRRCRGATRLRY